MNWVALWNPTNIRALLLGLLVFVICLWFLRTPKKLPPGPWGWPLIGYIPQLAMSKDLAHITLSKLGNRFGPIFSLKVANQLIVVLQDYDVIKDALDQHQLSGRPSFAISQLTMPGHGVLSSSGEAWVELRRFSSTALRKLGMGKLTFERHIAVEAQHLLQELKKKGSVAFNPKGIIENAVSNVICFLVFGRRFEYDDAKFNRLIHALDKSLELSGAAGALEFMPIFAKLPFLPVVKKRMANNLAFIKALRDLLDDHKKGPQSDIQQAYTDAFCNEMKAKENQKLETSMNISSHLYSVSELFGAGTETTTSTFRWGLLYMMAYPKIQNRVQQEIDRVVGRHRLPELSDKPELHYTQAVLCEIQRTIVVPLALPHKCMEDTTLAGYDIPEGALVIINLWHILHDPDEWTNPEAFHPERFLDSDGKFIRREKFIPFSLGRRFCLGERLAKMELFVVFTHLLHQFTFRAPEGACLSFEATDTITYAPIPYKVIATPRE